MDPITIASLISGGATFLDKILNPAGANKYKDPYVKKMQGINDQAIESLNYVSPEAGRRDSAMQLKTALGNATSGALNAATNANVNAMGGMGDAMPGAATTGARGIASVMGATNGIQQALAQGYQTAQEQEIQKTSELGKLTAQGANIGDMFIYDKQNAGSGVGEAFQSGLTAMGTTKALGDYTKGLSTQKVNGLPPGVDMEKLNQLLKIMGY